MLQGDQRMFYRKTLGAKHMRGDVPKMEKFEEFWAGIWEDNTKTPTRKMDEHSCKDNRRKLR